MATSHPAQSGETGHQGSDRQPGKDASRANRRTPGLLQAASAGQAQSRSQGAQKKPRVDRPDHLHPGPGRVESERSKGNLHHDQREPQPDMGEEFTDL